MRWLRYANGTQDTAVGYVFLDDQPVTVGLAQVTRSRRMVRTANPDSEFSGPLQETAALWTAITAEIAEKASVNPEEIGAASYDYLFLSAYSCLAYWLAQSAAVAGAKSDPEFAAAKLETARFYFARLLPRAKQHADSIRSGSASLMGLDSALF